MHRTFSRGSRLFTCQRGHDTFGHPAVGRASTGEGKHNDEAPGVKPPAIANVEILSNIGKSWRCAPLYRLGNQILRDPEDPPPSPATAKDAAQTGIDRVIPRIVRQAAERVAPEVRTSSTTTTRVVPAGRPR